MNRNELRHTDINLLVVFETMMRERSVTRTGELLFVSQTTISSALGRLRALFNDPLFVRVGRMMEPTARAEAIYTRLAPALDGIAVALSFSEAFDPATSQASFHVGLSDDVEYALLPELLARLRREAPGITLIVRRVEHFQLSRLFESGEVSVAISPAQELPANAHCRDLRAVRPMLLRCAAASEPLDLDGLCSHPQVVVSSMGKISDELDLALDRMGRQRKVVLAVPQFSALPALLRGTELVALVPEYVAHAMVRHPGLRADFPPLDLPAPQLSMAWRGISHTDPRECWLRSRLYRYLSEQAEREAKVA